MAGKSEVSARGAVLAVVAVLAGAALCGVPARALAHEIGSHQLEDQVVHTAADESRLGHLTSQATARFAAAAAAAAPGDPGDVGQWGPLADWPVVGVHVALLPNGMVLAYDSVGDHAVGTYTVQDHTRATVWDPKTGTQTPVNVIGHNIFCSGLAHLPDGSVFVAGGNLNSNLDGIIQTHTFDPDTDGWTLGPDMAAGRWYPSVTPLRDGEMLITSGGPPVPEVRTRAGTLRALGGASLSSTATGLYPWLDVAPDGRVFLSGPTPTMRTLDPDGAGAWQTVGTRDAVSRSYGSHALYDVGKILVTGGSRSSNAEAEVIDINGATPKVTATAPMAYARRQHNLTVLADGSVLATGGNSSGADLVDLDHGVYPAERWDPATGAWKTLAPLAATRQYHSTALLLADGRVLAAGGGVCTACDDPNRPYLEKNGEVFSPPYLFKHDGSGELAPRPVLTSAPRAVGYDSPFDVSTPDAASIKKLGLVRLGAVTHSVNMEQRYVPLSFTAGSGRLTATSPGDANLAPPGVYMLFAIDGHGVPSLSKMVTLSVPPTVTLAQPADGASATAPAAFDLSASAGDEDGVAKVEFFAGATKVGEDATAPYAYRWSGVGPGSYPITARATDEVGTTTTTPASTVTVQPAPGAEGPPAGGGGTTSPPAEGVGGATGAAPGTVPAIGGTLSETASGPAPFVALPGRLVARRGRVRVRVRCLQAARCAGRVRVVAVLGGGRTALLGSRSASIPGRGAETVVVTVRSARLGARRRLRVRLAFSGRDAAGVQRRVTRGATLRRP